MDKRVSWKELVAKALGELGGEASLKTITEHLAESSERPQTATWEATIRRVVRQYKLFESVTVKGRPGYRLVLSQNTASEELEDKNSLSDPHGEQQAMLLELGRCLGYETFTNSTDKTIRSFGGRSLSEFTSLRNDAVSLRGLPLAKIRDVDAMWMEEDSEGPFPRFAFEVEHSTGVKSGLTRLLKIPARFSPQLFIIGAGKKEADLFSRYLKDDPFRSHAKRFQFRTYDEVRDFYKAGRSFDLGRNQWGIPFAGRVG